MRSLRPRAVEVLRSTHLTGIFEIFDDEAQAIASFAET